MTYITDDEIDSLPEDSEEAFVVLESFVRARYEKDLLELGENESPITLNRRYMSIILPSARHYGVTALADWQRPGISEDNYHFYENFIAEVDYCITELRLRNADRGKLHSVALNPVDKTKLRHLLKQMRETVDEMEMSVAKKECLFSRINAVQDEVDRDRTRYQAYASLLIEACDDAGEAAKRLEPVLRLVERFGAALGVAKRFEDAQPKLPPRSEQKRIEPPNKIKSGFDKELDDEIPF